MTDTIQTALTVGMPTLAVLIGILVNNFRLTDLSRHMDLRFSSFEKVMDARFDAANQQLLRVEGVLDAQFKSLESRLDHLER